MKAKLPTAMVFLALALVSGSAIGQTAAQRVAPPSKPGSCILRPGSPALCSEVRRTDGGSIRVTARNPRAGGQRLETLAARLSERLPNALGGYSLEDFSDATAAVAPGPGTGIGEIKIQICWQGKRRQWCVGVEFDNPA